MPELAEIKIMKDFVNDVSHGRSFDAIQVSHFVEKRLPLPKPRDLTEFRITADARGKELLLTLHKNSHQPSLISGYSVLFSMGMSGHWTLAPHGDLPKHTHLSFLAQDGTALCLVDARRFARWKYSGWASHRGPCPLTDYQNFQVGVLSNLNRRAFDRPIAEVLMDQRYFNGIGNYLRAEILYRADQDPFESARSAILNNPMLLDLCMRVPGEAYAIGGGQLKDWENPFQVPPDGFNSWIKCYGRSDRSVDIKGRRLWYFASQVKKKDGQDDSRELLNGSHTETV
jgi:endonuclease VIII-like 1